MKCGVDGKEEGGLIYNENSIDSILSVLSYSTSIFIKLFI